MLAPYVCRSVYASVFFSLSFFFIVVDSNRAQLRFKCPYIFVCVLLIGCGFDFANAQLYFIIHAVVLLAVYISFIVFFSGSKSRATTTILKRR